MPPQPTAPTSTPTPQATGPTVSWSNLQNQAQQAQASITSQLGAIGVVQIGGQYYQTDSSLLGSTPATTTQAQQDVNLQSSEIATNSQNESTIQGLAEKYQSDAGKDFSSTQWNAILSAANNGTTDFNSIISQVGEPNQPTAAEQQNTYTQNHSQLLSALSALDTASEQIQSAGGAKGITGWFAKEFPGLAQYGTSTMKAQAAYEQTKSEDAAQITKAITGSSRASGPVYNGVLASLPNITDTPGEAQDKLNNIYEEVINRAAGLGFTDITDSYPEYSPQTTAPTTPSGAKNTQSSGSDPLGLFGK